MTAPAAGGVNLGRLLMPMSQSKRADKIDGTRFLIGIVMIPLAASCVLALGTARFGISERPSEPNQRPVAVRAILAAERERGAAEGEDFWRTPAENQNGDRHVLHHVPPGGAGLATVVGGMVSGGGGSHLPEGSFWLRSSFLQSGDPIRGPPRGVYI